ncbi:putative [histone H3]-lysine(4) N-trimethyltransferase chromatin remodeling SET family [Helianthus annuus]|uniref:Histone-lysine N-methyltransferase chromatin remodeling SET family n=1 Tax=Helianthus annuus TaxID=4232 RepID=A0A251UX92_HELAN|nr:histone-lysine N-methyltransferase EZA1 [Helianthus annuus]KAF5811030.1 putative histone-lysine N-methyltransferase chromatin remodeling SET family [Helianthus annuus]KAJ0581756.1 putative [histone H3]-lysine(4) N-trimethyltransferase chromatin remodeling SET family [Helianthus annuus]KAJ0927742.1 putative [histone H3]-lysine(4) N-trimethyltransferase chromatin remodeling SET family [Helianthus annuus]
MMLSNSNSIDSSKSANSRREQASGDLEFLTVKINQLKKQIQAERVLLIKDKVAKNCEKLEKDVSHLLSLSAHRANDSSTENSGTGEMLSSRIKNPLCILTGPGQISGDDSSSQEAAISISAKLPVADRIPPYTTWIFLARNQRMADDQSIVGRRRIYYDQNGSEALICSDSEEELTEPEEEKHEFSETEKRIIRMVSRDYEPSDEVIKILTQYVGGNTSEIYEAYIMLKTEDEENINQNVSASADHHHDWSIPLDKSLSASLDSLDNLFCRRCLVFDCRLHGYSQTVITPTERQHYPLDSQETVKPCSDHCYLQLQTVKKHSDHLDVLSETHTTPSDENLHDIRIGDDPGKRKLSKQTTTVLEEPKHVIDDQQGSSLKKQKTGSVPDTISMTIEDTQVADDNLNDKKLDLQMTTNDEATSSSQCVSKEVIKDTGTGVNMLKQESTPVGTKWELLEKELYVKGLEIFGKNSCLIARNLLSGLKTCTEVANYMCDNGAATSQRSFTACSMPDGNDRADADPKEQDTASRSRMLRRKGRAKKLKYSWKSAGHPSMWRRIADEKNQSCKQYIPCRCESMCGKECPCLDNATCCEKYCGCSKSCKNRFRGCHCAKSQCRSRQCPCFAAGRECDPDVCRNCWVSCGDGSSGEPPRRGEGQCGNMRLLLRQQQRILLAKSNVAGWGAFLKNSVNKNDYLGEYTGELISHREADKRGKIYDRANSSFLFDLNDQYVLDAYRKGDKLKFANHSSHPNCYAKVMMVAGDHRVGIFAKERIEAGEELFYDYRYGPDQAPVWARKPDGSNRDDLLVPQGRAKKH